MKLLFCHDHFFHKFNDDHYSPGKLDYKKLAQYLTYFSEVNVVGREKVIHSLDSQLYKSNGDNIQINSVSNLSSLNGLLERKKTIECLTNIISQSDALIVRLPSEIGLLALRIGNEQSKPVLIEVVANAKDCLWFSGGYIRKLYSFILEYRVKEACKNANYVMYVTNKYLQKKYPTTGNAIALSDVTINQVNTAKKWVSKNKYIVGMIGNPDLKIKGAKVLLEAVKTLRETGCNIEVRILGGKGVQFIKEHNTVENWFSFDGTLEGRENIDNWLSGLDLYIQPSYTEGMPRALIEAMSCGLPCIGSDVGGIPELLPKEALFKTGDIHALKEVIQTIILSKEKYNSLSASCVKEASNYHSSIIEEKKHEYYNDFIRSFSCSLL
jgi:glycosyltransferase involved in cell wall biosynthesis